MDGTCFGRTFVVFKPGRHSLAVFFASVLLILGAAVLDRQLPLSPDWLHGILLCSGVALAAYSVGWLGAVLGLALLAAALVPHSFLPIGATTGEAIACLCIAILVMAARPRITSFQQSESKLRALLASMNDLILVLDRDGRYVEIGPTAYQLLILPRETLIGSNVRDHLPPELAQFVLDTTQRALDERKTIEVDYSLPVKGNDLWFSASVSPMSTSLVLWVARDITRRKRAEDALYQSHAELEKHVAERTAELTRTIDVLSKEVILRRVAEEALRYSEKRYRGIVEQARDIIFTLDQDGYITSVNPVFEQIIGSPADPWIGKPVLDLIVDDHRDQAERDIADALANGGTSPTRATVNGPKGQRVVLEVSLSRQLDSAGYLGLARDITQREMAERELRRSERMLADAQRAARIESWEHDLIGNTVWRTEALYSVESSEPLAYPISFSKFLEFIPKEALPTFLENHERLISAGSGQWTLKLLAGDGSERTLRCHGGVDYDSHGKPIRIYGSAQDVTAIVRVEELLRISEERFQLIARATNDAVWDLDLVTQGLWCGEGFRTLFGYDTEKINPEFWQQQLHPEDRSRVIQSIEEALATGQDCWSAEYRVQRSDLTYANVLDRAYIARDAQMKPLRMVGAIMDTTPLKQMEDQLAQARRVSGLGRIAASMAHEFNNVLMGIQPNLEVIRSQASSSFDAPLDYVLQSVRRGKRITEEILRFTRPADPALQCVEVDRLMAAWRQEILPILGAEIELRISDLSPHYIEADPLQIAQVLTNLAVNARDAMNDRGGVLEITIDQGKSFGSFGFGVVKSPDRYVHFSIRDHGCGMSPEHLAQVFEPLFTTKKGGTGLGLAVSYQIVLRHGGLMFAESKLGEGSTFHVLLPATLPVVKNIVAVSDHHNHEPRRILIVEDEAAVAFGIQALLEIEGIPTDIASTGAAAVPAIERCMPDLVILDIGLPDLDGVEVYAGIAARWPVLPILFSSGHADAAKLGEFTRKPNVGLLLKPYDFDTLRQEVARLMERSAVPAA